MSDQYNPQQADNSSYSGNSSYSDNSSYSNQYSQPAGTAGQQDPGQTLGIVSLIASLSTFIGFAIIGPIVGIICGKMARTKSREAGLADNTLGKWGFILGIIFLILGLLGVILAIIIAVVAAGSASVSSY